MPTEIALNRSDDLSDLAGKGGRFERFDHAAPGKPSEVAAICLAGLVGCVLRRQRFPVGPGASLFEQICCQRLLGNENVPRPDLLLHTGDLRFECLSQPLAIELSLQLGTNCAVIDPE